MPIPVVYRYFFREHSIIPPYLEEKTMKTTLTAVVVVLLSLSFTHAETITIDERVQFQKMDGFGIFGSWRCWWCKGSVDHWNDQAINEIVTDLKLSIIREEYPHNFEETNDNNDPFTTDLSKFNTSSTGNRDFKKHADYWKALHAKAQATGNEIKFIMSVWSPEPWMKVCNCRAGKTAAAPEYSRTIYKLKPGMEDEFAESLVAFTKLTKQKAGVDLYGISIQNEPAFEEPYASCVYSPEVYARVLGVVGKRFKDEKIPMKFYGPEDVSDIGRTNRFFVTSAIDTLSSLGAGNYLDIMAVHSYGNDGVTPMPNAWPTMKMVSQKYGRPLWMTETGELDQSWFKSMQAIHTAIETGDLSGWVYWTNVIYNDGKKQKSYYGYKHYSRYIRPDARRVMVDYARDNGLQVTAYVHPVDKTMSMNIINYSSSTKTITLAGDNLPGSFQLFTTSGSENHTSRGSVSGKSVSVPGTSINTLYATGYTPRQSTHVFNRAGVQQPAPALRGTLRVFALNGRLVWEGHNRAIGELLPLLQINGLNGPFIAQYRSQAGVVAQRLIGRR